MWRLAKSLEHFRNQINEAYPNRSKLSDGTIGDQAHQASFSDHNPNSGGVVTAFDLTHDPKNGVDAGTIAFNLVRSRDGRIKYLIWDGQILVPDQGWYWQKYSGDNPHDKHIHISVNQGNQDNLNNWYFKEEQMATIATKEIVDSLAHAYLNDSVARNVGLNYYIGQPVENVITAFNNASQRDSYLKWQQAIIQLVEDLKKDNKLKDTELQKRIAEIDELKKKADEQTKDSIVITRSFWSTLFDTVNKFVKKG